MWMRRKSEIQTQRSRDIRCSNEYATGLSGHCKRKCTVSVIGGLKKNSVPAAYVWSS